MGYSTPKKPLDLKEFLSQPGKKNMRRSFGYRSTSPAPAPEPEETAEAPVTADPAEVDPKPES